jgi:AmmeMemoRadiSam system protein B
VPILIGSIHFSKEAEYGALLSKYLAAPRTLFVISSDFCHWCVLFKASAPAVTSRRGTRFSYTYYTPSSEGDPKSLRRKDTPSGQPIHKSISALDHLGMDHIAFSPTAHKSIETAHASFAAYLKETRNTICGRHPIGVLLAAAASLQAAKEPGWAMDEAELCFVRYEQSSPCVSVSDSSVSYASAVLRTGT